MPIQERILQLISDREERTVLFSELKTVGSPHQIVNVLQSLCAQGALKMVHCGVYTANRIEMAQAATSPTPQTVMGNDPNSHEPTTSVLDYVERMAKVYGIKLATTHASWAAHANAPFSGEMLNTDSIHNFLVELKRAGALSVRDMLRLAKVLQHAAPDI